MLLSKFNALKYLSILAIFFVAIYIGLNVNFYNNDDWVHYKTLENFLRNDFSLHPYIGSTFFVQGFMAFQYAKVFGVSTIPVLTAVISVANILILNKILTFISNHNRYLRLLALLTFVLNPLYTYSSVGFMTENYVIFFVLLAIYFQLKYMKENKYIDLALSMTFIVLGFFVKQYTIFLSISGIIYLAIKKKWQELFVYYHIPAIVILFYLTLFPRSEILTEQSVNVLQAFDIPHTVTLFLTIMLYLCFFTLPLSLIWALNTTGRKLFTVILFLSILFIQFRFLSVEDFPSLTNVFDRKGLFQDIDGNKSHWSGYHKFFNYMFYLSIATSSLVISKLILNSKKVFIQNKFLSLSFIIYLGLSLVLPVFYDRYILPLVVLWIIFLYKSTVKLELQFKLKWTSIFWLIIYSYLSYLFTSDFIIRNHMIQHATSDLVAQGVATNQIIANRAWNNYHQIDQSNAKYVFSHDKPETFDDYPNTQIEKALDIKFPFSLFIDNKIYLYRISNDTQ